MKIRIKKQELISDFPYIVQCKNTSDYWVTVSMNINLLMAEEVAFKIKENPHILDATGYLFEY